MTSKLHPGQPFQPLSLPQTGGEVYTFGAPGAWQILFVIRGQHCPVCKWYLAEIEKRLSVFSELGLSVAAVSADSLAQSQLMFDAAKPSFPLLYDLDEITMRRLGLYISEPRSPEETDHRFPEPALFVVSPDGVLQFINIANAPALRPDLDRLLTGLRFTIERQYPTRGTYK
jgi:peroxiredoxin